MARKCAMEPRIISQMLQKALAYPMPAEHTIPPAPLALHLFGPFAAAVHGVPLSRLRSRKGQWLLALLALREGREVERSWLMELLWPGAATPQAAASLRASLK